MKKIITILTGLLLATASLAQAHSLCVGVRLDKWALSKE